MRILSYCTTPHPWASAVREGRAKCYMRWRVKIVSTFMPLRKTFLEQNPKDKVIPPPKYKGKALSKTNHRLGEITSESPIDGWKASLTQWTWGNSGDSETRKAGVLQSMGLQGGHDLVTEQQVSLLFLRHTSNHYFHYIQLWLMPVFWASSTEAITFQHRDSGPSTRLHWPTGGGWRGNFKGNRDRTQGRWGEKRLCPEGGQGKSKKALP